MGAYPDSNLVPNEAKRLGIYKGGEHKHFHQAANWVAAGSLAVLIGNHIPGLVRLIECDPATVLDAAKTFAQSDIGIWTLRGAGVTLGVEVVTLLWPGSNN